MNRSRILFCAVVLTCSCTGIAHAARNSNGAMVVHTSDTYDYSAGAACSAAEGDPGACPNANTTATRAGGQVIWLLAAFPEGADPCVRVIYFGIDYGDANLDPGAAYSQCGPPGTIEIPDGDWPYGGRGNSIAFGSPICHDLLFPFYVFQVDGGVEGTSFFCTDENPTGGYAAFVDDGDPPALDPCYLFGCVRWGQPGANECPGTSQAPGACCYPDGSCAVVTAQECLAAGGVYRGDNEPCIPDPCPHPGACCYLDGHCEFVLPGDCYGEFEPGTCDPNPCPQPGACCQIHWCRLMMEDDCGGWDFFPHMPCDPNPCLTPGACCFPDGHCEAMNQGNCNTGSFYADSPCDPNPCPQPVPGACCSQDGSCAFVPEYQCHTGDFRADLPCDPNPCRQPEMGACCLPNGSCEFMADYQCGDLDFRVGVPCDPNPCPQPGACCTPDHCTVTMEDQCSESFYPGLNCNPSPCWPSGACCYADGHCEILLQGWCYTGDFSADVPCDPNPCRQPVQGACCFDDGRCVVLWDYACGTGDFRPETPCDPNPCPQPEMGACCLPDGTCLEILDYQCNTGDFRAGVPCDPNPCPQPWGACCSMEGHCTYVPQDQCDSGQFYPDTPCDPNPCVMAPPPGACCFPDGHCEFIDADQCSTGVFYENAPCDPNPCPQPVGACCWPDGSCTIVEQDDCTDGVFYPDIPCDPDPCAPGHLQGACCYPDGHCAYIQQSQCDGVFYAETPCEPNPCPSDCAHHGLLAGTIRPEPRPGVAGPTPFSPGKIPARRIAQSRDVCWSEPADLNAAKISSEIIAGLGLESEIANDFMIAIDADVSRAIAYGGMYSWSGEPEMTHFNLYFYDDQGCVPGTAFACYFGLVPVQTFIGYDGYGYPTYKLECDGISIHVAGGTRYWFGFQAANHTFPPQWGRQGTGGVVTGCEAVFKSAFFGYPGWVPLGEILGSPDDSAQELECGGPTPVVKTTWGAIKARYR